MEKLCDRRLPFQLWAAVQGAKQHFWQIHFASMISQPTGGGIRTLAFCLEYLKGGTSLQCNRKRKDLHSSYIPNELFVRAWLLSADSSSGSACLNLMHLMSNQREFMEYSLLSASCVHQGSMQALGDFPAIPTWKQGGCIRLWQQNLLHQSAALGLER